MQHRHLQGCFSHYNIFINLNFTDKLACLPVEKMSFSNIELWPFPFTGDNIIEAVVAKSEQVCVEKNLRTPQLQATNQLEAGSRETAP